MVSYSLRKGIEKFKERGVKSDLRKMKQLHDREFFYFIRIESISPEERKRVLESPIFLVEKKDGRIKARHYANGSPK